MAVASLVTEPYQAHATDPFPGREDDQAGIPAEFGQLGSGFTIVSDGTGITAASSSRHGTRPASDSYSTIADPGAAGASSTAQVTVVRQAGGTLRPTGTAGLIERSSLTTAGVPVGVALSVSTSGQISMVWAAGSGTVVDSTQSVSGTTVTLPVTLRLQRSGSQFTGAFSTDGGMTWTTVGAATVPAAGTGAIDAGMSHSSGSRGALAETEAAFSGFAVSGSS